MSFSRLLLVSTALVAMPLVASAENPPASPPKAAIPTPPAPAAAAPSAQAPVAVSGAVTRQELPGLVKEILMNDPEIVMQAVQKLREKQAMEAKQKAAEALVKRKDDLVNNPNSPSVGDAKTADVTLVEFFDYHCGYCKRMLPDIAKVIAEDKKLRVVFKEFPILGDDSNLASRMALAVNRIAKDKYFDFHTALMKHEGKFDEKSLLEIAKKLGISGDKLKAEAAKPEINAILDKNREIAEDLGIRGTPALIIGNEFMPGAMSYDDLKKAIANARGGNKPAEAPAPAAVPAAEPKPAVEKAPEKAAEKKEAVAPAPAAPAAAAPAPAAPMPKPEAKEAVKPAAAAPAPAAPVVPPPAAPVEKPKAE